MNEMEIKNILPHRKPMLLLDEVFAENGVAKGIIQVRGDEWFLSGHFPDSPIVPGVILCEMMAQTCCVLLADELKGRRPLLTGLEHVRFRSPVVPGDVLETECRMIRKKENHYKMTGNAYVRGKLCVCGEMLFMLD